VPRAGLRAMGWAGHDYYRSTMSEATNSQLLTALIENAAHGRDARAAGPGGKK
jgi:hypothetical protein